MDILAKIKAQKEAPKVSKPGAKQTKIRQVMADFLETAVRSRWCCSGKSSSPNRPPVSSRAIRVPSCTERDHILAVIICNTTTMKCCTFRGSMVELEDALVAVELGQVRLDGKI